MVKAKKTKATAKKAAKAKKSAPQSLRKTTAKKKTVKKRAPDHPNLKIKKVAPVKAALVKEAPAAKPAAPHLKELELKLPISVKELSVRLQQKPSTLIKELMKMGVLAVINHYLEETTVEKICEKFGFGMKKAPTEEEVLLSSHQEKDSPGTLKHRAPIVTLMGHVDHGKTSLLDAIRKTNVVDKEHGGITQHIGAYRVVLKAGEITFLDTPGHEAFTALRARGASVTDIVVLVVAADDGIMPQTQEAIDHARAAGVPIIIAINKVDKQQADIDKVKKQLAKLDLMAEDWGGKTITVPVSAKTGKGIDNLLEMIILEAQMLELKANPDRLASGVVLEAKISKGRGPVATVIVHNGTLRLNQNLIAGKFYGKIKAMFDDHARSIAVAPPSYPIEVLGMSGVPDAGEPFFAVEDEKSARDIAFKRKEKEKLVPVGMAKMVSLEELHAQIEAGKVKDLKLIIKSEVQGSLEAVRQTLEKLNVTEIKLNIIHAAVGGINTSDVLLAIASNAVIVGFNVAADTRASELVSKEGIDMRTYNIIYELSNDIKAAVEGMLDPKLKRKFLGKVLIKKVFKLSSHGTIAGCMVSKGRITRSATVDLVRNGQTVFEGKISSLKRFKDDVRDVGEGFECGISLGGFDDYRQGDVIEAYEIEKVARKI
ncbi:translation initiation factor IF-2 [Candidatus Omnitrophota bacterium]